MTTYASDTDGTVICVDCLHGGCVTAGRPCEAEDCRCECRIRAGVYELLDGLHERARRAREVDERHPDKLDVIAAELEHEARPDVQDLTAERFRRPRRA